MDRPLEGIRALDCGIYHAGPGGLAILGDLGAEVIKIEQPKVGDPMRRLWRVGGVPLHIAGDRSLFFEGANRNKKSVTIDLKTEKGNEILHRLVRESDILLTNMRPGARKKLRMTYPLLKKTRPDLIYASVSAFGPKGPEKDRGGFDYLGQARSGFMHAMGEAGTPPVVCQFGIIDQATAIMVSQHIMTALYARERTGKGQEIQVSILGSALSLLYFNVLIAQLTGGDVPRHRRTTDQAMRNYYRCKDGRWIMLTLTPPARYWKSFCAALGHPELEEDPRFSTDDLRWENAGELVSLLDAIFLTRTVDRWLQIFQKYDLLCCAVQTVSDLHKDPQVTENGYLVDFDHPTLGKVKIPGYTAHFSENAAGTVSASPDLGEHTEEVLMEIGSYTKREIDVLKEEGVI
ncbi:MAG: CoA transferase [Deltaproteobacteria bacterium]|nr:CoA transferase [Deltaproteobacteria bacterium]